MKTTDIGKFMEEIVHVMKLYDYHGEIPFSMKLGGTIIRFSIKEVV